ncbi:MAG: PaaI family thioesterase [Tepidiformaceae bacterium]
MQTLTTKLATLVPASRHLGTEVLEARGGRSRIRFDHIPELLEDSGQLKAAALMTLAKTASASALISLLGIRAAWTEMTVTGASARSNRMARGSLIAEGEVVGFRDAMVRDLDRSGSATIRISVTIEDDSERPVSEIFVDWHIHTVSEELRKAA